MRCSIRLNNDLPLESYPRLARAAERLGFDQFWVSDNLFLRGVWVILAAVAQDTERIGIGTCIVNPYTIHPAELAMAAGTLDELAGGRLHLGISSGADDFLGWIGVRAERPVTAVTETTRALRHLFAGGRGLPDDGAVLFCVSGPPRRTSASPLAKNELLRERARRAEADGPFGRRRSR